jgi:Gram-negative bacterial TonB protein C-terminal
MSQRNLTQRLIQQAAERAPESLADRLKEEWLSDLEALPSGLSRLRFAIGCCWAILVIAYEHQPAGVAVSNSAVASQGLIASVDQNIGFLSLRSSTFFLVLSLHVALIYGLMTALSHTHKSAMPDPLQNQTLQDPRPREKLPLLLPDPALDSWAIDVPKPVVEVPPDASIDVTTTMVEKSSETHSPPQPVATQSHVAQRVTGGPGDGFPYTADFYPSLSMHLGEQGISTVQVCVDSTGRLTSEPTTLQTAGSPRLDAGALKLARAGSGHYRATTEDGQPVNSCYPLRIRFQLKN